MMAVVGNKEACELFKLRHNTNRDIFVCRTKQCQLSMDFTLILPPMLKVKKQER
jgi:hypothetical protein